MKLLDMPRKYGAISRFWIANQATIIIASPELMKPILSSHRLITKSREYNLFKPLLSEGLLVSTGKEKNFIKMVISNLQKRYFISIYIYRREMEGAPPSYNSRFSL